MARLIPLIRPTTCSCSSLLEVLAMASQQIRLHSPWNYTLLILSEADSADAQLPQCLEEYQLSPAQSESKDRMCACYPEETFLKILQDSESFLSYFPYAAAWASYPTPPLCKLGATDSFSHLLLTRQLCHFLLDKAHTAHSFRFFWGWFPARLSLSDQQKEMPRLCSQWKIRQHISWSTRTDTAKKTTALNSSLAFTSQKSFMGLVLRLNDLDGPFRSSTMKHYNQKIPQSC